MNNISFLNYLVAWKKIKIPTVLNKKSESGKINIQDFNSDNDVLNALYKSKFIKTKDLSLFSIVRNKENKVAEVYMKNYPFPICSCYVD